MRVLLTTDTVGGVWTFTKELSRELLRRGHEVALVSFGQPPSQDQADWCEATVCHFRNAFRCEFSTAPLEWMRSNEAALAEADPLLRRVIREFDPDILHCNQFCFGSLDVAMPRLITAHSDVLSWAAACRTDGHVASAWLTRYRSLVQSGLDGADAVVAPTQWMLDALGNHFEVPSATRVILNGRTLPFADTMDTKCLQAVSAGRLWDEAKNLALLERIDPPVRIFIAGELQHEDARVDSRSGQVVLLGALPEARLLKLFRQSSIYIASSMYEPFGLAPLEAALCGCAVIANDLPSLREVWGDAALYFQDAATLVCLLSYLKSSPATLRRARQSASRRALQLSASRMTEGYLSVYNGLLTSEPRTGSMLQELVTDAV